MCFLLILRAFKRLLSWVSIHILLVTIWLVTILLRLCNIMVIWFNVGFLVIDLLSPTSWDNNLRMTI